MNRLHSYNLKRRFEKLNPGLGSDLIDWTVTGKPEKYEENLEALRLEYPMYRWDEPENYDQYARDNLRSEAQKMGFTVTIRADAKPIREPDPEEFYSEVCESLMKTLTIITGERGSGKSTIAKNIIKRLQEGSTQGRNRISVKVFDSSTSWFHKAPLPHRQTVTWKKLQNNEIMNIDNCIYELGELSKAQKKLFVSNIIKIDYSLRYSGALKYGSANPFNPILYVFEEAESFVGSYELRGNDRATETMRDFTSIGRNFLLSGIFICSAMASELSPTARRRSRIIYSKTSAYTDLAEARRIDKRFAETIRTQPRYSFAIHTHRTITAKTTDEVTTVPQDYEKPKPKTDYGVKVILDRSQAPKTVIETPPIKLHLTTPTQTPKTQTTQFNANWWTQFILGMGIFFMFVLYLRAL